MLAKHLTGLRTLIVCVTAMVCTTVLARDGLISGMEALSVIGGALGLGGGKGILEALLGRRQAKTRATD